MPLGRQRHRVDEDQTRWEGEERDGGRGKFESVIAERYSSGRGDRNGGFRDRGEQQGGYSREGITGGRLGGANDDDVWGEVKFKGRGSMKYRERR